MRTPTEPAKLPDGYETYIQKGWRKCKEQPIVPLGTLATVAAFIGASRAARTRDKHQFQKYLRLRVIAQGVTVLGCVVGAWWIGREARKAATEQEVKTGRVVRESKFDVGLSERIKEAQMLTEVEERIEKRPPATAVSSLQPASNAASVPPPPKTTPPPSSPQTASTKTATPPAPAKTPAPPTSEKA